MDVTWLSSSIWQRHLEFTWIQSGPKAPSSEARGHWDEHGMVDQNLGSFYPEVFPKNPGKWWRNQAYGGFLSHRGTPKSSNLVGFAIIKHPFWGTPIYGNHHMFLRLSLQVGAPELEVLTKPDITHRSPPTVLHGRPSITNPGYARFKQTSLTMGHHWPCKTWYLCIYIYT